MVTSLLLSPHEFSILYCDADRWDVRSVAHIGHHARMRCVQRVICDGADQSR